MKMSIKEMGDVIVVSVEGNIMQEYVSVFRTRLKDLIDNGKIKIVLVLEGLNYMSSMCLAAIIDIKNKTLKLGGDISMASASELIANLLTITNLRKKIALFDSIEEAVEYFKQTD